MIAIIAILAAILFPVFAQAKAAAKKTVDLSNLKQMALASEMFKADHDDYIVKSFFGDFQNDNSGPVATGNPWYTGWDVALQPYIKSKDLYRSPLDSETIPREFWKQGDPEVTPEGWNIRQNGNLPGSFRLNDSNNLRERFDNLNSSGIDQPAESIRFAPSRPTVGRNDPSINYHTISTAADAVRGDAYALGSDAFNTFVCIDAVPETSRTTATAPSPKTPTKAQRGQGKANYAFDDGHAKSMAWGQTWKRTGPDTKSPQGVRQHPHDVAAELQRRGLGEGELQLRRGRPEAVAEGRP